MGDHDVKMTRQTEQLKLFIQKLLRDLRAFSRMLDAGQLEMDARRIGAEQEMFLINRQGRAAMMSMEMLDALQDQDFTTELGRFNLELNLPPLLFQTNCLSDLEQRMNTKLQKAREVGEGLGTRIILTGILPTLQKSDLTLESMAPMPRYKALNDALHTLRGGPCTLNLRGHDELHIMHNNVMLEATCTSFQLHYQVSPSEFAHHYNIAQLISAPMLAVAGNAPLLFGRRLWRETRIPVFQQAVDTRRASYHLQERYPRVSFGTRWVEDSVLEVFQEDISRFQVLLDKDIQEDPIELLNQGLVPKLQALCTHNGTVYRWNRACYGSTPERAHIRIENRILPSGPSVVDEVANAALFFGLMSALPGQTKPLNEIIPFEDARSNFLAAAQHGLDAKFRWLNGERVSAQQLVLETLIPMAREGLQEAGVDGSDIDRYLGIMEERVTSKCTGSEWMLSAIESLRAEGNRYEILHALVHHTTKNQWTGEPVHTWPSPTLKKGVDLQESALRVQECMTTDLFTIQSHEPIMLAARLMEWRKVRHIPVLGEDGKLAGLLSFNDLIAYFGHDDLNVDEVVPDVSRIMQTNPVTITPSETLQRAIDQMATHNVTCLPVLEDGKLVGIITEHDFIRITSRLLSE